MPLKSEIRRPKGEESPKAEGRRPKAERNPKSEIRRTRPPSAGTIIRASGFGLRVSFGLRPSAFGFPRLRAAAFSLIEIMVTVGLLSFIILGLLAMFNQTQRAFKTGMTQTDVLEAGRATMDLLAREMEQMAPSEYPDYSIGGTRYRATNFFVEPSLVFPWNNPLLQDMQGNGLGPPRTNLVQRFFFLSKLNQDWLGTGYEVLPDDANGCVGTLYRFAATNYPRGGLLAQLSGQFLPFLPATNLSRIADGVVHLRLRAFAKNGYLITPNLVTGTNASFALKPNGQYTNVPNALAYGSAVYGSAADYRQAACYFMSNALPAYLELELGILEPQVLQKYRSIALGSAARQYLSNHVGQVHIFRQRIPVRNVDLSAYP